VNRAGDGQAPSNGHVIGRHAIEEEHHRAVTQDNVVGMLFSKYADDSLSGMTVVSITRGSLSRARPDGARRSFESARPEAPPG
jgi:hypothetical protein